MFSSSQVPSHFYVKSELSPSHVNMQLESITVTLVSSSGSLQVALSLKFLYFNSLSQHHKQTDCKNEFVFNL